MQQRSKRTLLLSGILTVLILTGMDSLLLPAIERAAGGLRCFDLMTFGYDFAAAQAFLTALTEEGRQLYLWAQLPLDTLFLVVYTVFFLAALRRLFTSKAASLLPVLLAVSDFAENTCTLLMLRDSAVLTPQSAAVFGTITLCKSLLMYAVFAALIAGLLLRLLKHQGRKEASG